MLSLSWDTRNVPTEAPSQSHRCERGDIDWDEQDDPRPGKGLVPDFDFIYWTGKCNVCGREVEERFYPGKWLFDSHTGEDL